MPTEPNDASTAEVPPITDTARPTWSAARRLRSVPEGNPGVDRLAGMAARILGVPSALIVLVADDTSVAGSSGIPLCHHIGSIPLRESLATLTAHNARPVVITDASADTRTQDHPGLADEQIGSYLGVPMTSDSGHVVGAVCVFDGAARIWAQADMLTLQELAAAAAAELELSALTHEYDDSRARWDHAIEAAGIGNFDWNLTTGTLLWDEPLIALFGYDGDEQFGRTIEDFNTRLHPDDVPHVSLAIEQAIATVGEFEAEYRVILPDGRTRWIQARGRARSSSGVADRLLGSAWDVSATRRARDRAAQIVAAMPVGYLSLDTTARVLAVNNIGERMLGRARSVLVGRTLGTVLTAEVGAPMSAACVRVALSVQPENLEIRLPGPGETWLEATIWPDLDGVAVYLSDITARRRAQDAMKRAADHDKSVAIALQDALLTRLPDTRDVTLEARYLTAAMQEKVGGDWYDALIQPSGNPVVTVGDVVGHDIAAAAIMGQLRTMLRAFAWDRDYSPAQIMSRLDRAIADLHRGAMATVVTARFEPAGPSAPAGARLMRWTNAGHPPPIVVTADGSTEVLERSVDLLLGVDAAATRSDHVVELQPGSTVVLYTDGLVETRDATLDTGIARLADSLRRHCHLAPGALLDAVLAETVATQPGDDVAILAIRIDQLAG